MLYDEPELMLRRASELASSEVAAALSPAQWRAVATQLRRLGAMWPHLFATLARENEVLSRCRDEIAATLDAAGHGADLDRRELPDDPVARYRVVLQQLNGVLPVLHEHRATPWGAGALADLRRGLHTAAAIQAEMVDAAWSA